jgi:hypothetical protein
MGAGGGGAQTEDGFKTKCERFLALPLLDKNPKLGEPSLGLKIGCIVTAILAAIGVAAWLVMTFM